MHVEAIEGSKLGGGHSVGALFAYTLGPLIQTVGFGLGLV